MLRRFRLEFARGSEMRHQREVNEHHVLLADVVTHLANRFEEWKALDVAYRPADLDDADIGTALFSDAADRRLDLVRDVGDHLNGRAEIIAAAFFVDNRRVDLARRHVVDAGERLVDETLVVAEIEVRFRTVFGHEDLTVLIRVHRAGVDVNVRIQFLDRNGQPPAL
jgi:hypothetical protein